MEKIDPLWANEFRAMQPKRVPLPTKEEFEKLKAECHGQEQVTTAAIYNSANRFK